MTARDTYPHGVFCWVDLCTADTDSARTFYSELFGVTITQPTDSNRYMMAKAGDRLLWGLMPQPEHLRGMPDVWETFIKVDDVDDAAARVEGCGGSLHQPVIDVGTGRLAVAADPTGAVVILWEPREIQGAHVVGEHGAMCWHDLVTSDVDAAMGFYSKLLGWTCVPFDEAGSVMVQQGDEFIGSASHASEGVPPHWAVCFEVDDCDAAVERCGRLGGRTVVPAVDHEPGRMALLADHAGAHFWVVAANPDFSMPLD